MPDEENTWPEIRDHSFLHIQIPRSMLALLFSPLHSFSIGFRFGTGMAIADVWFCAQWPIFVLILIFVFGSLSCWKIQTWPFIRFLAQAVRFRFFQDLWQKIRPTALKIQQSISLYTWGTFYPCMNQPHIKLVFLLFHLTIEPSRSCVS